MTLSVRGEDIRNAGEGNSGSSSMATNMSIEEMYLQAFLSRLMTVSLTQPRSSSSMGPVCYSLKTRAYRASSSQSNSSQCSVCLADFEEGDIVAENSCSSNGNCQHIFHKSCIQDWIRRSNTCPLCKEPFCDAVEQSSSSLSLHDGSNTSSNRRDDQNSSEQSDTLEAAAERENVLEIIRNIEPLSRRVVDESDAAALADDLSQVIPWVDIFLGINYNTILGFDQSQREQQQNNDINAIEFREVRADELSIDEVRESREELQDEEMGLRSSTS